MNLVALPDLYRMYSETNRGVHVCVYMHECVCVCTLVPKREGGREKGRERKEGKSSIQGLLHHCLEYVTYLSILFVYLFNELSLKTILEYLFKREF